VFVSDEFVDFQAKNMPLYKYNYDGVIYCTVSSRKLSRITTGLNLSISVFFSIYLYKRGQVNEKA